jgi:hypothetical protein
MLEHTYSSAQVAIHQLNQKLDIFIRWLCEVYAEFRNSVNILVASKMLRGGFMGNNFNEIRMDGLA